MISKVQCQGSISRWHMVKRRVWGKSLSREKTWWPIFLSFIGRHK